MTPDRISRANPAAGLGLVLVAFGLLLPRPALVLLGAPLLLAWVWARLSATPARLGVTAFTEGEDGADYTVGPAGPVYGGVEVECEGLEAVRVRVDAPNHRPAEVVVCGAPSESGLSAGGGQAALRVPVAYLARRTGVQPSLKVTAQGFGALASGEVVEVTARDRLVLPTAERLGALPTPRQLRGLSGSHTSRRRGDGTELYDINPGAGLLRRIDWRTTLRRSPDLAELYARRTLASAEAAFMLVVDSREDLGGDLATWTGLKRRDQRTSLDISRDAAASVAGALIAGGDRVGLADLARPMRVQTPAAGRRHLRRLEHALALTSVSERPFARVRAPLIPTDAACYIFSVLLDDEPARVARAWAEAGHQVVLVDTMPLVRTGSDPAADIAWRVLAAEKAIRVETLEALGVPVVAWVSGPAAALAAMARAAARHRPLAGGRPR